MLEHNNHEKQANEQTEICFYDRYHNEYNKWRRMYYGGHKNGERISYKDLLLDLESDDEYKYTGCIMNK